MGEIKVHFDALQSGEQGIRTTYARLVATLEQLDGDLAPMLQTWSGSAQQAYAQCKRQWDAAANGLAEVLERIAVAVGEAHSTYVAAERAAQSAWS